MVEVAGVDPVGGVVGDRREGPVHDRADLPYPPQQGVGDEDVVDQLVPALVDTGVPLDVGDQRGQARQPAPMPGVGPPLAGCADLRCADLRCADLRPGRPQGIWVVAACGWSFRSPITAIRRNVPCSRRISSTSARTVTASAAPRYRAYAAYRALPFVVRSEPCPATRGRVADQLRLQAHRHHGDRAIAGQVDADGTTNTERPLHQHKRHFRQARRPLLSVPDFALRTGLAQPVSGRLTTLWVRPPSSRSRVSCASRMASA